MRLNLRVITPLNTNIVIPDLQLPIPCDNTYHWGILADSSGGNFARFYVNGGGGLILRSGMAGTNVYGELAYPIK